LAGPVKRIGVANDADGRPPGPRSSPSIAAAQLKVVNADPGT